MRGSRIVLGLIGVFGLSATVAADPAIYMGGGVGQYNLKIDGGTSYSPPEALSSTAEASFGSGGEFEDSAAVWRVFAGYQFDKLVDSKWMPNIAVQADYFWYSTTQSKIPPAGVNGCSSLGSNCPSVKVNGDAWELSVRPSYAITDVVEVFARVGYNWYNIEAKQEFVSGESDSNDAAMYSGGLALNFTPNFAASVEYEVVDVDAGDLDSWTVNFVYKIPR